MGFFSFFRQHQKQNEEGASISVGSRSLASMISSQAYPALQNSSFWACVTNLCREFATIPLHLYQRDGRTRTVMPDGPLAYVMEHPCPYMSAYSWRFLMGFNFEIHGVAMAIIERTMAGDVRALYPVSPRMMTPVWTDGRLSWIYSGTGQTFADSDVLRFFNTPAGTTQVLCPVEYAERDLEVGRSSQDLQRNYFKNGTLLGSTLTVPKGTSQDLKDQLKGMLLGQYSGTGNGYKTMIIEDSMKFDVIHLDDKDTAKMEAAQSWTLLEVARRFGVPPFFIGDLTKATYANSEQQGTQLVLYALQPRFVSWETTLRSLCAKGQYFKFNLGGLMRGDHATRSAFYHNAIMDGWMSINEVRELEDLNPVPDGDRHFFPLNYTTLANVGAATADPAYQQASGPASPASPIEEKRQRDRAFLEAVKTVTKSSRSEIENVIRKQLKAEIETLKSLVAEGKTSDDIVKAFETFAHSIEAHYGEEYYPIYQSIMTRLLPIVQKQIGSAADINSDAMDAYAGKYAQSMSGRHATNRVNDASNAISGKDMTQVSDAVDSLTDGWLEVVPKDESQEETARAGNAFDVFLFGALGLAYMHVVAGADACEFCQGLDGKVVSVNGTIVRKGTTSTDGAGNVMTIHRNLKHPPFHTHCNCGVAPGK